MSRILRVLRRWWYKVTMDVSDLEPGLYVLHFAVTESRRVYSDDPQRWGADAIVGWDERMKKLTPDDWRRLARFVTRQPESLNAGLAWRAYHVFMEIAASAEVSAGGTESALDPEEFTRDP